MLEPTTLLRDWVQTLPEKEYPYLSPSSLGGCPRAHYFKLKGIKPTTPPNPGALLNFQIGFLWEDIFERALKWSANEYKSQEKFIDEKLNIGGTCDFLIKTKPKRHDEFCEELPSGVWEYECDCTPQKEEWEIWDSKTQGSMWFKYNQGRIARGQYNEFKEEFGYIIQQLAYIYMARRAGYNVIRARLAYISKDDGFVGKVTDVYLTPENEKILLDRIKYMNDCLATGSLPRCECEGWKVGYCNYGNPLTMEKSRTGKMICTDCCPTIEALESWR